MPWEDLGSKAAAIDDDEFHWPATGKRRGATLSSKGRQGHATLSMALDDEQINLRAGLSTPEGFNTKWGWIPFRDPPSLPPTGEGTSAFPTSEEGTWKLIKWGEVPTDWVNGFTSLEGAMLAICLPDQEEAWGYARFFRATNTDQRLTACVDPQYDQTYGIQAGIACLSNLATTGKPILRFCLLTGNYRELDPG